MLSRVSSIHSHNTRSAGNEIFMSTQDQRSIAYRVPKEWQALPRELKDVKNLMGFKKRSKQGFIKEYRSLICEGVNCYICRSEDAR